MNILLIRHIHGCYAGLAELLVEAWPASDNQIIDNE